MKLNQRVLILLGAGLCCAAFAGCQESNEATFAKSAPPVKQGGTGGPPPPKDQMEYYKQQQERAQKSMSNYPGQKK